ncbi:MAG: hypothetical protein IJ276_02030 [Alphaproteobacteria bacterium]|nr:hypothetical protein [Alphaproteobacteria bacterium]
MNYFVLFLGLLLSGCIKTMGPTHLSFYVDVPKQEPSPSKAVFSSVVPTDGPDGVCIYKNGKCDYSDLDFLIKDLKKEFKSNYLATHYALSIYYNSRPRHECGYMFMDSNIAEHENEYETKSNNLVLRTWATCPTTSFDYRTYVFYQNTEIGQINLLNSVYDEGNREWVKNIVPKIAVCAAKIGFKGKIGGEEYFVERPRSPSMEDFFKQCDMEW